MGYRKLLKDYMHHIKSVIGGDLVELASMTNALGKRDIGELRAIAAELKRESFAASSNSASAANYNHLVLTLLLQGNITLQQLNNIEGIEPGDNNEDMREEDFIRILLTLLEVTDSDTMS